MVPRDAANRIYLQALKRDYSKPLKNGGQRKLGNMAVNVTLEEMQEFKDAWHLIRGGADVEAVV